MSDFLQLNIRRTSKELSSLAALIGKSSDSRKKYHGILEAFVDVFHEIYAPSVNEDLLIGKATQLLYKAQQLNDNGENLDIKQMATQFATRIKGLKPDEVAPFISALKKAKIREFIELLTQEFSITLIAKENDNSELDPMLAMAIRNTTKELVSLASLIGTSSESKEKYHGLLELFGSLFQHLYAPSVNINELNSVAEQLLDKAQRLNDSGENLDIKRRTSQFATRIRGLKAKELRSFITAVKRADTKDFIDLLNQELQLSLGVDQTEGAYKRKEAAKDSEPSQPEKIIPNILFVNFCDSGKQDDEYGLILPTTIHYLSPRVRYSMPYVPKTPIKVSYRIFSPTGEMEKNDSHPDGFLDSKVLTSREGTIEFAGWGNTDGTAYYEGRWRFELYCESELIHTTYFEIKSPFSHVPPSIDIQKVEFANTDYDGGILNDFGSELPQNTQYLTPRIFFTVRNKENHQIELRYIIYGPNGLPIKSSSRNDRYTVSSRLNLAWNSPTKLSGFGNREGNSYLPGRYKVEIYEGDYLLYTTYVNIGKPQQPIYTPPPTPVSTDTTGKSKGGCFVTLILTAVVIAVVFGLMKWCERDNSEDEEWTSIGVCQITGNGVNLRHGPGTEYDKVGVVSSGESYQLLEESGDWVKIDYDGSPAWLSSKFCNITYASDYENQLEEATAPGARTSDSKNQNIDYRDRQTSEDQGQPSVSEDVSSQSDLSPTSEDMESPTHSVTEDTETSSDPDATQDDNSVHVSAEKMAEFPGGMPALMRWLSSNIHYPESAQKNDIQGRVIVKFIVEKDGSITNAQVIRSVDSDLDREALRVVSKMPKWIPGKNGGMPVRSYFTLPVSFRLQEQ